MKTLSTIASLTIAGVFSVAANAADLSQLDYEHYANNIDWPTHEVSSTRVAAPDLSDISYEDYAKSGGFEGLGQFDSSIASIQGQIDSNPTAAGNGMSFSDNKDLLGHNVYEQ